MKRATFQQIIDHVAKKGAVVTKIDKSTCFRGCIAPGDIYNIEFTYKGMTYIASACRVFDEATIDVDRIIKDGTGRCVGGYTVKQLIYSK